MRNSKSPDIVKMLFEALNLVVGVPIEVLDSAIFWACEEVVRIFDEFDLCDSILVHKHGLMAVSKVKAPELDVLVGRSSCDQGVVRGDVEVLYR